MSIRRVVTGFDDIRAATFVSDTRLSELQNLNTHLSSVWRSDGSALRIPPEVDVEDKFGFPSPGGAWVLSWSVPPNCVAGEDAGVAPTAAGDLPSGGAHATDSIDVNVVLSGQAVFQLQDGSEKTLEQGDSIVVNGVAHTWHNRRDEPLVMLSVIFGAARIAS